MAWDVVILGGGVAGLTAAVLACESGLRPLLLESAHALGGRARSFRDRQTGEILDNGPHVCAGAYHYFCSFLEKIGKQELLTNPEKIQMTFWTEEDGWHSLSCPDWPAPWHLLAGLAQFMPMQPEQWAAVFRLSRALMNNDRIDPAFSVTHWAESLKQTPWLFQRIWVPLCQAMLNEPTASASAALFASVLRTLFLTDRQAGRILLPKSSLAELIALPAAQWITAHGGTILCNARVVACHTAGKWITSLLTSSQGAIACQGKPVIAALPPHALTRLLPAWPHTLGGDQWHFSPIVSVYLRYKERARLPAPLVGLPLSATQWITDRQQLQANAFLDEGARFGAVFSGAYRECHWRSPQLVQVVHADLCRLLPTLQGTLPISSRVIKEQRATLSHWPKHAHDTRCGPRVRTKWQNLFLAGDWTDTEELPCTLESAAKSGTIAIVAAIDAIKKINDH